MQPVLSRQYTGASLTGSINNASSKLTAAFVYTVMRIKNLAGLKSAELAEIEAELSGQQTLADMIRWGSKQPPGRLSPRIITGVVVQDEFTHDIFVPWGE